MTGISAVFCMLESKRSAMAGKGIGSTIPDWFAIAFGTMTGCQDSQIALTESLGRTFTDKLPQISGAIFL